jgi:TrmH family RNA methyltransferase
VDPSKVEIVLVRPSRPANVAAACRAMKNMGLRALWLVGTRPELGDEAGRALAYGAWDVLDGARRADSLLEAVSTSVAVVGTTGLPVAEAWSPRRLAAEAGALAGAGSLSLVFGPEATGLTSAERSLCHRLVRIPTDEAQPSLNLAQAVLLLAYELRLAFLATQHGGPGRGREGERGRGRAGDRRAARGAAGDRLSGRPQPGPHPRGAAGARHPSAADAARGRAAARPRAPGLVGGPHCARACRHWIIPSELGW